MSDITSFEGVSGQPRTAEQLLAILEKIDLAIYNLLNEDKNAGISYRIGERSVERAGYLRWLLEARRLYMQQLASLPAWQVSVYDDPDL
ncbi:MAG: hypothetical protein NZM31_03420 [Gemmatales bacterium]|nr:hypothetical protein [Gemmatales bacterium]MDW8386048.1 hypothetical protein [Gemmatales bacterium]